MPAMTWSAFLETVQRCETRPAILHGSKAISFAELRQAGEAWAACLEVAPGARVLILAENSPDFAAAVLGCWRRGALPVIVHADAPERHRVHAASLTGAVLALTDREASGLDIPILSLSAPPTSLGEAPPAQPQSGDEPASIVFTSGSTGLPKGAVQSAANLISGARRVAAALGYGAQERLLCPIPFAFDYGWGQLLSTFFAGHTLVLPEPRSAFGVCAALDLHAPTVLAGVPAVFADLLSGLSPIRETQRASVRLITNTGSRIPNAIFEGLVELFPDALISLNYGLTETYRSACLPVELAREMPDCVGYPLPGVSLAVVDQNGTACPPEQEGEIVHRGAGAFLGYWGEPEKSEAVLRPDPLWAQSGLPAPKVVWTGDLGRMDAAGRLYIHGRRDRQMKSMGVRVSPDEVEEILEALEEVAEAAVTCRPHDTLGDMVVALIRLCPGMEEKAALKAVKAHARAAMSPYMQPREYILLPALPRTATGKPDYAAMERLTRGEGGG